MFGRDQCRLSNAMAKTADMAFQWTLAECGCPPSMFVYSDGTAQCEALRRWHMAVVVPVTRLLEHEFRHRLEEANAQHPARLLPSGCGKPDDGSTQAAQAGAVLPVALAAVGLGGED